MRTLAVSFIGLFFYSPFSTSAIARKGNEFLHHGFSAVQFSFLFTRGAHHAVKALVHAIVYQVVNINHIDTKL